MKKINHITMSFAISLWIFYYLLNQNIFQTCIYSLFVALLAPIPDIDIKIVNKSWILTKYSLFLLYPIHFIIKNIFKHRTITHTIWIPTVLIILIKFIENQIVNNILIIVTLSLILHILEDAFTINGVEPIYPIPIKIRFAKFSTNSTIHFLIFELISYSIVFLFIGFLFL